MVRLSLPPAGGPALETVAAALRAGGVVAVPSDTLYGLSARADRPRALARIADLKGRREPFLVLVADPSQLPGLASEPPPARALGLVWPGPVTLLLRARPGLPALVAGAAGTVAVRWPRDPLVLDLLARVGTPIVSTSINRHGEPPLADPEEIAARFGHGIDVLADAGELADRLPSTIVDLTQRPPALVRRGAGEVDLDRLADALGSP